MAGCRLWNIRSGKRVYAYKNRGSAVSVVVQSPAVDVVAVGRVDGSIQLLDLRLDEVLVQFSQSAPVTGLAFNTDERPVVKGKSGGSRALLVSSGTDGGLVVWDLDSAQRVSVMARAHDEAICGLAFLPNEPLLVSASEDNVLKMWIFDQELPKARLLKRREGHSRPPSKVRFYGESDNILSASRDGSFRMFHCWREQQNCALSQKAARAALKPICDIAMCPWRQKDWANVITSHQADPAAHAWSIYSKKLSTLHLRPDGPQARSGDRTSLRGSMHPETVSVAVSSCGNFALCGTDAGVVFKYNLQSGRLRGHFPKALRYRRMKRQKSGGGSVKVDVIEERGYAAGEEILVDGKAMHEGPVYGVEVDALNAVLITGGFDGTLRFWDFRTHKLIKTMNMGSPVDHLEINRSAGLVVFSCDDLVARAVDLVTKEVIRSFRGHSARITDLCITADARWVVSSSEDTSVRVWDVPTGRCIEWMEFPESVTSVSFSADQRMLAMAHANSVGISLWVNNAHFGSSVVRSIAKKPIKMLLPADYSRKEDELHPGDEEEEIANGGLEEAKHDEEAALKPKKEGLVTLSSTLAVSSKWLSLAYLDLIKRRNKPIEPPKAPESAPFFLPVSKSVRPVFEEKNVSDDVPELPSSAGWDEDGEAEDMEVEEASPMPQTRIMKRTGFARPRTKLCKMLEEASLNADAVGQDGEEDELGDNHSTGRLRGWQEMQAAYTNVVGEVKRMSPSAVDFEIQSLCLGVEDDDGARQVRLVLKWLVIELKAGTNFEVVQAFLHRVIHVYKEVLQERDELRQLVAELHSIQEKRWLKMRQLMQNTQCLIGFFSKQQ